MSEVEGASKALQREITGVIERWGLGEDALRDDEFDELALRVFAFQLQRNAPYAAYCRRLGFAPDALPTSWDAIPAAPAVAYKEHTLATFDIRDATLVFESSGTTSGTGSMHYMERRDLYDAALLAGFDRFMLADGARLRYLNLLADLRERPRSSLSYMMARVAKERGDGHTGWYVRDDVLAADEFFDALQDAARSSQPVCIATTAFALAFALDAAHERSLTFALAPGSRVMETGGFKGRAKSVRREELYARTCSTFGIAEDAVIAEYGMTELTSQWYDVVPRPSTPRALSARYARDDDAAHYGRDDNGDVSRRKAGPPWLRARAVGLDATTLPDGVVGGLVHVDLANLSSCVAVATEDLGATFGREIVLLGRDETAEIRGCSLDAESLAIR
ncbi:MAG: hypothetical protein ACREMP_08600 [Candidatus Tyrphobacter sp.]